MKAKDLSLLGALIFLFVLLSGSLLVAFFSPSDVDATQMLQGPSMEHLFGTDSLGRDLLMRVLEGSRISLLLGCATTFLTFGVGITYAVMAYRWRGWRGEVMMRFSEILMALPSVVYISVWVLFFSSLWIPRGLISQVVILTLSLTLSSWMWVARQVRTWIEAQASLTYVEAARALGASEFRVLRAHILPNISSQLFVFLGLQIPQHLLFESFLSFVGLGIQPPTASWGVLIQEGWKTLSVYPHLILVPSLVLFATVLSFNLIFERLRTDI